MRLIRPKRELIPRWEMPADPVKAVFWFMHWLLMVLVRFFYIVVLAGVITESILNGIVGGVVTFLVGLGVWAGLAAVLFLFNIGTGISKGVAEISRMQRGFPLRSPFYSSAEPDIEGKIVEGTVTDLEEERRKRRQEM
jgi:hypothetical protein